MGQPAVAADVEDDVVAVLAVGEVLARVVDDVVGAEGADQVHLRGAAHAGDLGAERLGDLHGEAAHAARRADDQHVLPGLHPPWSRTACSAVSPGDGHGGRLARRRGSTGLGASLSVRTAAYSAKEPSQMPYTSSPGANRSRRCRRPRLFRRDSGPGLADFGRRSPKPATRMG